MKVHVALVDALLLIASSNQKYFLHYLGGSYSGLAFCDVYALHKSKLNFHEPPKEILPKIQIKNNSVTLLKIK